MPADFLLESVHSPRERLGRRRAAREPEIYGNTTLGATKNGVGEGVVPTTIRARAHGHDPLGVDHLIVNGAKNRGHLVGDGTGNNDNLSLAWGGTGDNTNTIHIVTGSVAMHHFNGAARKTERERPGGVGENPLGQIVDCHLSILKSIVGAAGTKLVHQSGLLTLLQIQAVSPLGATTGNEGLTLERNTAGAKHYCNCKGEKMGMERI